MSDLDRRQFLRAGTTVLATAALGSSLSARAAESPSNKIVVGVMGVNGRGRALAQGFTAQPSVEIAYICDVDSRAIDKCLDVVGNKQERKPQGVSDFRRILDDKAVDALVIAAPDHWHAPATIMACTAGKHVYVEKPASHNGMEGELAVAAARKNKRVVQLGTQRRSMPGIIEGIAKLREGAIGRVLFSRGWYNNQRPSIGHGKPAPVPQWLDYTLWQGPAPEREYRDNILHYNWHWFWHWGTGELGNNGIHSLDVCRWGLDVGYPTRVTSGGGKYRHDDDQETPDTHVVTFDFGDKTLVWEGRSWHRRGFESSMFGMAFYGDAGTMIIDNGYKIYDAKDKLVTEGGTAGGGDGPHLANFLDCIRTGARPNADIEDGVCSTALCHLGNIAQRTGRTVNFDPAKRQIIDDAEAAKLWTREYRQGWEPKV